MIQKNLSYIDLKNILLVLLLGAMMVAGCDCSKPGVDPNPDPKPDTQAPSVPTGLTGTSTNVQVNLQWNASTDNVGVKEYIVAKDGADLPATAVTNLSIGGLTPNTPYSFTVKAKDAAGNTSAASAVFTISTQPNPATPPTVASTFCGTSGTMAQINSSVTSDGGATVTARGVCFGTTTNPTIAGQKTTDGSGTGNFLSNISGLSIGTRYYVRAYATNNGGTSYGNEYSFTAVTISAPSVLQTLYTGVELSTLGAVKICWNTSPVIDTTANALSVWDGHSLFRVWMSGLNTNTTYYTRVYTVNNNVVQCSSEIMVTTLTPTGTYYLGQSTGGGIVFWASSDGNKALVAATSDINPAVGLRWWPQGGPYIAVGATNNDLGGGDVNTNTIANHPQCLPDAAARRCYDLVQSGFSDWYLGNKAEVEQLYLQRNLPGLAGTFQSIPGEGLTWWTSLETTAVTSAWMHGWSGTGVGIGGANSKGALGSVRPTRKVGNW